jgi:enoyl-CoA hydratase/carnithine racemase
MKISFPMIGNNFHRKQSSKSNSDIVFKNQNHIGIIVLNRPKQLNSLVISIIEPMFEQLEKWEKDSNIKAVVIKSSSEEVFSAGGDMKKARMWSLNGKHNNIT